ncbi:energy transducer TonB [uncultured Alteromonas sp.]|jgi:outer membrane biosynthesis protein TonB|uniref:energy transducer TonB n=1 Tax=uncultured Alteromonas sp. TaxID=179113 RepID=UPI0025E68228|nr:TonB family protein [uncultured Alteromonas sp.]
MGRHPTAATSPIISTDDIALAESNLIVRIDPKYPSQAARDGLEGWVMLSYNIDKHGSVSDITVLDASPK